MVAIANHSQTSVCVFSLSTCNWGRIDNYRHRIIRRVVFAGVLNAGEIYWWSYEVRKSSSVSSDLDYEVFNYIILPP